MSAMSEIAMFRDEAAAAPVRATRRALRPSDIDTLIELVSTARKSVRVYSSAGFVPNAYRFRCQIQYIEALAPAEPGERWTIRTAWTGAQRSHGAGALRVVDGRAAA